ncbi:MAG TPA: hypothetical protein VGB70_02195 [Allosphingosinicella sp.]
MAMPLSLGACHRQLEIDETEVELIAEPHANELHFSVSFLLSRREALKIEEGEYYPAGYVSLCDQSSPKRPFTLSIGDAPVESFPFASSSKANFILQGSILLPKEYKGSDACFSIRAGSYWLSRLESGRVRIRL